MLILSLLQSHSVSVYFLGCGWSRSEGLENKMTMYVAHGDVKDQYRRSGRRRRRLQCYQPGHPAGEECSVRQLVTQHMNWECVSGQQTTTTLFVFVSNSNCDKHKQVRSQKNYFFLFYAFFRRFNEQYIKGFYFFMLSSVSKLPKKSLAHFPSLEKIIVISDTALKSPRKRRTLFFRI